MHLKEKGGDIDVSDKGAERNISLLISDLPKVILTVIFDRYNNASKGWAAEKQWQIGRTLEIPKYVNRSSAKLEKN